MSRPNDERPVYRYKINGETPSRATYLAVAEAEGCDPMALPPLMHTIDTESLDALTERSDEGIEFTHTFEYAGRCATITDEEVSVGLLDDT